MTFPAKALPWLSFSVATILAEFPYAILIFLAVKTVATLFMAMFALVVDAR